MLLTHRRDSYKLKYLPSAPFQAVSPLGTSGFIGHKCLFHQKETMVKVFVTILEDELFKMKTPVR